MFTSSPDQLPQKSLQIKQDDKFFSKILSKESSMASPSVRVYYGGVSVAVPFLWESQPGTPKHPLCDTSLPPLTPPPSYYSNHSKQHHQPTKKHSSRSKLLHTLFLGINLKKTHPPLSPSSSSSSSSHSSMFDQEVSTKSATLTTLCSGVGGGDASSGGRRGGYSVVIVKKALLGMVNCVSG